MRMNIVVSDMKRILGTLFQQIEGRFSNGSASQLRRAIHTTACRLQSVEEVI